LREDRAACPGHTNCNDSSLSSSHCFSRMNSVSQRPCSKSSIGEPRRGC
jgi:hypothetical protein